MPKVPALARQLWYTVHGPDGTLYHGTNAVVAVAEVVANRGGEIVIEPYDLKLNITREYLDAFRYAKEERANVLANVRAKVADYEAPLLVARSLAQAAEAKKDS